MTDLPDFLLARVAERVALAPEVHTESCRLFLVGRDEGWCDCGEPARVLAECEAKRRIVEDALFDVRTARRRPGWTVPDEQLDEEGRAYRLGAENQKAKQLPDVLDRTDRLLRLLALPYADHPDCRAEWRA